ncbi:glycine cleavage system H protein (lipoate-binding) [Levilactobacillus lindianensis]|uniref:glycine cleavage system H protein (lipoate-binding) n=1 Tax=Levilactobacillus lindianensis TaxID=2486018 RepID=UPI000F73EB6B|nr:glycine cleavage system H protein (lipoate-binding) [Levilactobacillus lindianensis]
MIDKPELSANALWLAPQEAGVIRIGFADDGRELLGPVTRMTWLVKSGNLELGTPFMTVEGAKDSLVLRAPFAGRIVRINHELGDHLEWLDHRNDERDWLLDIVDD